MQILAILRVSGPGLQLFRDPLLINVETESARLMLNTQSYQTHLYTTGDEIFILNWMEYGRKLGTQARDLYPCRVGELAYGVSMDISEINLKLKVFAGMFHLEVVHRLTVLL
jgi:hypothetical protein